jgi:hypothetical protein
MAKVAQNNTRIMNSSLSSLLSKWEGRLSQEYDTSYKDALRECIYELRNTINEEYIEDAEAWEQEMLNNMPSDEILDYLQSQEADNYLSSMEAHEHVA